MTFADDIRRSARVRDERRADALATMTGCVFYQDTPGRPCCFRCIHPRHPDAGEVLRKADSPCATCRCSRLRIAAVITSWNEGDEVQRTVASLRDSVSDDTDLCIILVDDGSTDGSCGFADDPADVTLRHCAPRGVGVSRNAGYWQARHWGAHIVSFHDAHMRFPSGGLERLARRAVQSRAIVCSGSTGLDGGARNWGCDMFWNRRDGLQPKWRDQELPADEWSRSPCPMGAGYVMDMRTAARLRDATGELWDDTAGRWGFSEQALAVKAFLLDVPVEFSRDVVFQHLYRTTNPTPNAAAAVRRNVCYAMARILGEEMFGRRFRAWCEKGLGEAEVVDLLARTQGGEPVGTPQARARLWTHLIGKRAPIAHSHPAHSWLERVDAAIVELGERFPKGQGARILQWRPGEATMRIWQALPEAELHCIARRGHRADNWHDLFTARGLKLGIRDLGAGYVRPPASGYDLILIGGDAQDGCEAVARGVLREGGRVLLNPQADKILIADEFLKKEKS